jgi:hypothetical protein
MALAEPRDVGAGHEPPLCPMGAEQPLKRDQIRGLPGFDHHAEVSGPPDEVLRIFHCHHPRGIAARRFT